MVARAHVVVSGRVQGIFFRQSTREEATAQGVFGWVRNMDDGRVEAVFEGDILQVKRMVQWCHVGPRGAVVDGVEERWDEAPEWLRGFYVKR